jgi:DNA-directed RNA polymerase specialized sigma24 family protein
MIFADMYELHVDRVYRFIYRKVRDRATAGTSPPTCF